MVKDLQTYEETLNENLNNTNLPRFYMAWNKDLKILKDSSSGGVFSALAQYVLSEKGIIFGASLNARTREVEHIEIDDINDLYKLRWSKYYQSNVQDIYKEVKASLGEGQLVLFSGTPCQIAALYAVCGSPKNLITIDVLCHGVTSKYVVNNYIKSQEKKFKKDIKTFYFRVKDDTVGWENGGSRVKLIFFDGTIQICDKATDTFYVGYNKNLILRESCYHCKFCGTDRYSDFTMADFWGIDENKVTSNELKNGVSLMLVNSKKGKDILPHLNRYLEYYPIDPNEAIPHNRALVSPVNCPSKRNKFFSRLIKGKDYNRLIKAFFPKFYLKNDIKNSAKTFLGEDHYKKILSFFKSLDAKKSG